jgi:hypothetical protein
MGPGLQQPVRYMWVSILCEEPAKIAFMNSSVNVSHQLQLLEHVECEPSQTNFWMNVNS